MVPCVCRGQRVGREKEATPGGDCLGGTHNLRLEHQWGNMRGVSALVAFLGGLSSPAIFGGSQVYSWVLIPMHSTSLVRMGTVQECSSATERLQLLKMTNTGAGEMGSTQESRKTGSLITLMDSLKEEGEGEGEEKIVGVMDTQSDDENVDYEIIGEQAMDQSLERAVKQMVMGSTGKSNVDDVDPVEKFDLMYKSLKAMQKDEVSDMGNEKTMSKMTLNPDEMLKELFPVTQEKEPFDERKVISKLRQMMKDEDFNEMFRDSNIGDLY